MSVFSLSSLSLSLSLSPLSLSLSLSLSGARSIRQKYEVVVSSHNDANDV